VVTDSHSVQPQSEVGYGTTVMIYFLRYFEASRARALAPAGQVMKGPHRLRLLHRCLPEHARRGVLVSNPIAHKTDPGQEPNTHCSMPNACPFRRGAVQLPQDCMPAPIRSYCSSAEAPVISPMLRTATDRSDRTAFWAPLPGSCRPETGNRSLRHRSKRRLQQQPWGAISTLAWG
jgi:hypothetical protein